MKITFFGAAGMVTGSCYLLKVGRTKVVVDMGMFQGSPAEEARNREMPNIDVSTLNGVIVTHAHLDHCGRLPMLVKRGYGGYFYMTRATKSLLEIVLLDSAKVAKEDEADILYEENDVLTLLSRVQIYEYDEEFEIGEMKGCFKDAGHILGSASLVVTEKKTKKILVFSGDLGNTPEPLIHPTETISKAETVVMESTYGNKLHEKRNEKEELAKVISRAEKSGGVVLIPSFSIQRSQDLLYLIDHLKKEKMVREDTPVFLDSPMAIKATEIYKEYPELLSHEVVTQAQTDDPFDFTNLVVCDDMEKSRAIRKVVGVKVIIAGSGMMSGGRILFHALEYLNDEKTELVIVGFQAENTVGRQILDGNKWVTIKDKQVEVRAKVTEITTMSAHADQLQLLNWLKKIKGVRRVILTHGEDLPRLVLAEKIRQETECDRVELPVLNQEIEV